MRPIALVLFAALSTPMAVAQVPDAPAGPFGPAQVRPAVPVAVDPSDDPALGREDAPVTIVQFCDFQCPFCAQLSHQLRQLVATYPNGVRVVFRDFPLDSHPDADVAAEAASCAAEQGRFWPMHDALFGADELGLPSLRRLAGGSGLDVDRFVTCVNSGRYESEWRQDRADGWSYGVTATPTFFVNGLKVEGVPPWNDLVALVQQAGAR